MLYLHENLPDNNIVIISKYSTKDNCNTVSFSPNIPEKEKHWSIYRIYSILCSIALIDVDFKYLRFPVHFCINEGEHDRNLVLVGFLCFESQEKSRHFHTATFFRLNWSASNCGSFHNSFSIRTWCSNFFVTLSVQ